MHLARGTFRLANNHRFTGPRFAHILYGCTAAEGTCHGGLDESASLGTFVLGGKQRHIVAVAPELRTNKIEEFAWTGFVLITVDRPEWPTQCWTGCMIRIIIVLSYAACCRIRGILGEIRWFPRWKIDETDTTFIAALDAGIFGKSHNVGLAIVAALTGFTVCLYATGGGARVAEHDFVLLFEFGHVVVGRDFEGGFTGGPRITETFFFNCGDDSIQIGSGAFDSWWWRYLSHG